MSALVLYAAIHGLHLYYEDVGKGRPLVLIHGGGSTVQTSSFEEMADDTAALLERLGVREADVLGFSNGGMVAMQLAIRHPSAVRRLVICSSFFAHDGLDPSLRDGFKHATAASMPPVLRDAYRAVAPHPEALEAFVQKTVAMMRSFRDIPEATLRALAQPMLVMAGDADVVSVEHEARLAHLVSQAQLAIFPGSGHLDAQ